MISIDSKIVKTEIPLTLGIIQGSVSVKKSTSEFLEQLNTYVDYVENTYTMETYKNTTLEASRKLYRKLGKDPSRYRISSDSLMRRLIKHKGMYYVNNVVDINNLISLKTLWSIGAYDFDKISGPISYSVGRAEDLYEGIGRGILNIDKMPVLRDQIGPFGSATSDSIRTMVTEDTKTLLMVIHGIGQGDKMDTTIDEMVGYLKKYADLKSIRTEIIQS